MRQVHTKQHTLHPDRQAANVETPAARRQNGNDLCQPRAAPRTYRHSRAKKAARRTSARASAPPQQRTCGAGRVRACVRGVSSARRGAGHRAVDHCHWDRLETEWDGASLSCVPCCTGTRGEHRIACAVYLVAAAPAAIGCRQIALSRD